MSSSTASASVGDGEVALVDNDTVPITTVLLLLASSSLSPSSSLPPHFGNDDGE